MACVALPTCGLALAESERYLPSLITRLDALLAENGLDGQPINVRMTGCPNGCARPYIAEIGFVGRNPGKYNLHLGGNRDGSRLNRLYREDADEDTILATLAPLVCRLRQGPQGGRGVRRLHHPPAGGVTVYLVGAGPGDPELLTVKASRVLQGADVVLHDSLVDARVLGLAPAGALLIDVGKRCGTRATAQSDINRLICYHAGAGGTVVRLKGGDPMIFGRADEELAALQAAGIACEVVPGVTAATAAAAALGLSLTKRQVSRALHILTGHGADGALPAHHWVALANAGGTLALYMGGQADYRRRRASDRGGVAAADPGGRGGKAPACRRNASSGETSRGWGKLCPKRRRWGR